MSMSVTALLTKADGSVIGPAMYSPDSSGNAPATITVAGAMALFTRGPEIRRRVLGTNGDVYNLTGSIPGGVLTDEAGVPLLDETGAFMLDEPGSSSPPDPEFAQPGGGSPGLLNPGDPGSPLAAVTYTYAYAYSAPVLTSVGER